MNTTEHPQPLAGIRVVEVGVWYAGPGGSAILADLGAEVIKVEAPEGDPDRYSGGVSLTKTLELEQPSWTVLWDLANRGKKGISIDLHSERGQEVLKTLVASADVFLTNLRRASGPRLGIDYETLSSVNPQLIQVNVDGYGRKGDLADQGSFDTLAQALAGTMWVAATEAPQPLSLFFLDHFTAITVSHAVLTALVARNLHGIGQQVDVSLLGAGLWLTQPNLLSTSLSGVEVDTGWDRAHMPATSNIFQAGDGKWLVGVNPYWLDTEWTRFATALGHPEWSTDPRYATAAARIQQVPEINELAVAEFAKRPRGEWLEILTEHKLRFAPVLTVAEAIEHPQVVANGYIEDLDHPVLGRVRVPAHPVQFSKSAAPRTLPAPVEIGQDTEAVLRNAGLTEVQISELIAAGVISVPTTPRVRVMQPDGDRPV
jgi:crotonobetainyl-CoA:carnitine CoA-transferase CaiB-like acyl-CoA transferase